MKKEISKTNKTIFTGITVLFVMLLAVTIFTPASEAKGGNSDIYREKSNNSERGVKAKQYTYGYAYKHMVNKDKPATHNNK